MSKLYVGNLSYNTTDDSLRECFGQFGTVTDSKVMLDRETGRSRGFGFVTLSSEEEAQNAITQMDGQDLEGRRLRVNPAQQDRSAGRWGGGGGRGGGYGGGGFGGDRGGDRGGYGGDRGGYGGDRGGYGGGN
ncbi:RNA recognition motif domain-containing protein [Sarocladium implicatum]|nr:RNA recognition motif domain-containing protein [Sarocladium implicatum]